MTVHHDCSDREVCKRETQTFSPHFQELYPQIKHFKPKSNAKKNYFPALRMDCTETTDNNLY